ncbi:MULTISPECIES: hypothetical protein [Bacillus]|uniref:hypothetical protein n=1 Tax=Bacillus TaxID=1386 RepID=UPI0002F9177E|nr:MULTISPECIES: hypothetical protein [Bacillus]
MKSIEKEVYNFFVDNKTYPTKIYIHPDYLNKLEDDGEIHLSSNNTNQMLLGIEVYANKNVHSFKLS